MKEKWLAEKNEDNKELGYISKLKERLYAVTKLTRANLQSSQQDMKTLYDRKAKARTFAPGDKVLVLLPVPGQPLKARYNGPYVIQSKVGDLDYIVATPDRRKTKTIVSY